MFPCYFIMFQCYFIERVKLTKFQFKVSGNGLHFIEFNIYFNTANLSIQEQRMKVRDTLKIQFTAEENKPRNPQQQPITTERFIHLSPKTN